MKKLVPIIISAFFGLQAFGQVVINVQLPASSIYLKNQLWNLSLVNADAWEPNIRIELLLTDVATNQPVLSAISGQMILRKGVTQVNPTSASPVTYNVLNPGYNVDANPMGYLPLGTFNICYRLLALGHTSERVAEECEIIEIEPLSPPQLILPFDEDTLLVTRPLFTWLAPSPQIFMSNPSFDLNVVEVLPSQNSASAIQQNIPVYSETNLSLTAQSYPASYPELDTAKLYAWQITAKNNNNSVAKSEVWTFRIKQYHPDTSTISNGVSYSKLRRVNDAAFTIASGKLNFEYVNELNETAVHIKIFDISNSGKLVALDTDSCQVQFGQNLVQFDLDDNGTFISKRIYLFELVNGRNEKWYLRFQYKQPY